MALLTDGLLLAATLFAGTYCWVLARRVEALKDLDKGLGGAIVRLTRQIELARSTLDEARATTREGRQDLAQLSHRAEAAAGQLRLLLAAVNDPNGAEEAPAPRPQAPRRGPARPVTASGDTAPKPRAISPVARVPGPAAAGPGVARPAISPRPRAADAEDGKGEEEILATLRALAGGEG